MFRRNHLRLPFLLCVLCVLCGQNLSAVDRPNVIIIYGDDLGFGDIGVNGAPARETFASP